MAVEDTSTVGGYDSSQSPQPMGEWLEGHDLASDRDLSPQLKYLVDHGAFRSGHRKVVDGEDVKRTLGAHLIQIHDRVMR